MHGCKRTTALLLIISATLSTGCKITPPNHPVAIDQMHNILQSGIATDSKMSSSHRYQAPKGISNALMPDFASTTKNHCIPQKRFDVSANQIPAKTFFMSLVSGTPYNMVIDPNVTGNISLELKNVTIKQVLEAVRDTYGFEFHKNSYGYEILPAKLETKIFTLNYLDVKRKGKSRTEMTSGQISEQVSSTTIGGTAASPTPIATGGNQTITAGTSVDTRSEADFWHDIEVSLKSIVGRQNGRSVAVNSQSGVIIVNAFPPELHKVSRYLQRIQTNIERQVILEAKVLEVQLSHQFQAGIDWNLLGQVAQGHGGIGQTAFTEFPNTALQDFSSIFTLRVKGDFGGLIKLLQTQGNIQVLSSPHIATINNQKAVIKVGTDQFYVTGVSTTNVATTASSNVFPTQNINLTPFFSGVTLDVTPQISSNGEVILHIHPTVSRVVNQQSTIVLGNNGAGSSANTYILPLAQSTIRESDNIVRAKSGQVIVIGGLMENNMEEETAGVPVVSKIPFIGTFFRRTQQHSNKIELVILLRPLISNNKNWVEEMVATDATFHTMREGFHQGGWTKVFGNEGECED